MGIKRGYKAFCYFLAVAIFIISYGLAMAAPVVVSSPQPEANKFRLRLCTPDGSTCGEWVEGTPVDGGCWFSLANVPKGIYKGEVQAGGFTASLIDLQTGEKSSAFEWSESAFFALDRTTLSKPTLFVRMSP